MSKYEQYIAKLLLKEKIDFEREKTFSDLRKGKYRFDFYIEKSPIGKIIIEVDGQYHFQQIFSRQEFLKQKEHDRRKNSYCLANSIPLYRIPYWEIYNVKSFEDIINDSFKVTTMWHNDRIEKPKKEV